MDEVHGELDLRFLHAADRSCWYQYETLWPLFCVVAVKMRRYSLPPWELENHFLLALTQHLISFGPSPRPAANTCSEAGLRRSTAITASAKTNHTSEFGA